MTLFSPNSIFHKILLILLLEFSYVSVLYLSLALSQFKPQHLWTEQLLRTAKRWPFHQASTGLFLHFSIFYTSSSNLFNQLQMDSHILPGAYIPWCLQVSADVFPYLETESQPHVLLFIIMYHIDQPLPSCLMFTERKILLSPCFIWVIRSA